MKRKLFYIADFSLPNMSAYALHVLKMCDAFSEKKLDVNLLIQFLDKKESLKKCLPGIKTFKEGVNIYRKYYSEEDEKNYGIVAILFEIL